MALIYPHTLTNGTTADATQVQANFTAAKTALETTEVTSLPGSPFDGQHIALVAHSASSTVWHLRYRSTVSRWEYLGGSPLRGTAANGAANLTLGASFQSPPSPAEVVAPLAGEYWAEIAATVVKKTADTVFRMAYAEAAASSTASLLSAGEVPWSLPLTTFNVGPSGSVRQRITVGSPNTTVRLFFSAPGGAEIAVYDRKIILVPVWVA